MATRKLPDMRTPNVGFNQALGLFGTGGDTFGYGSPLTTPSTIPAPPKFEMSTERDPRLERLAGTAEGYLGQLRKGDTSAIQNYMQAVRDAREGGRKSLLQSNMLRGAPGTQGLQEYEAGTQREMAGTGRDVAELRERMMQGALGAAVGAAQAPMQGQLAMGQLGLAGYQAQLAAHQAAQQANLANRQLGFDQTMALRSAMMSSPAALGMMMGGYGPGVSPKGLGVKPRSL